MKPVRLHRIDAARNMRRYYRLDLQPDLFGGVLLVRQWERIGARGRTVALRYDSEGLAADALQRQAARKVPEGIPDIFLMKDVFFKRSRGSKMKLVDEIIDLAVDHKEPLADVLRRCVVLAYQLKNENLKTWVQKELDGYRGADEVPDYRLISAGAKGLLIGPSGSSIDNQPIPPSILKKELQHFATTVRLNQPVASYEVCINEKEPHTVVLEWPADLTLRYQSKIIQGYSLNRAWQEIPRSSLVGLIETVRNRVLKFALEIKDELGLVSENVDALQPAKVDQMVINNIYGGHNIISTTARDITQFGNIKIQKGDFPALENALTMIGLEQEEVSKLKEALDSDAAEQGAHSSSTFGHRVSEWFKERASKLASGGLNIGGTVAKAEITKWILQYLGLS